MTQFFDITINGMYRTDVRHTLEQYLSSNTAHQLVTLNPEMLVEAQKQSYFCEILQQTDLRVTDGFGIQFMAKLTGQSVPDRITGSAITDMLCKICAQEQKSIFLLGGGKRQARSAAHVLRDYYDIDVAHAYGGIIEKHNDEWRMEDDVIRNIKNARPDVLLVALGHRKQEQWIHDHLSQLPSVRVAVGVGGVFTFLVDDIRRAPKWIRRIGMEWFWRLMHEPSRIKRIFTAVIVFPIRACIERGRS